jgi:hypothetical protein
MAQYVAAIRKIFCNPNYPFPVVKRDDYFREALAAGYHAASYNGEIWAYCYPANQWVQTPFGIDDFQL